MKKNGMGRACSKYGIQAMCIQDFGGEILGKRPLRIITLN